jgi:hypothetical protein
VRDINIFHHFRLSATALVLTEIIGMTILNKSEFKRASATMGHWLQDYYGPLVAGLHYEAVH